MKDYPVLSDEAEVARELLRPTEMLERQLLALRKAAQYRNPETGRRNFCHEKNYRPRFILSMRTMRRELQRRIHENHEQTPQP